MLGIRPGFEELVIDPCIPGDWEKFEVVRKFRGAIYNIKVTNPDHVQKGVKKILLDGREVDTVPVLKEETEHNVEVIMG